MICFQPFCVYSSGSSDPRLIQQSKAKPNVVLLAQPGSMDERGVENTRRGRPSVKGGVGKQIPGKNALNFSGSPVPG